ncbi:MAG: redoxin domain-containing protein [Planctomycetes bacterium]|nr:redoxin domain-containing protein [Planctomycetota bacterium]
MWRLALVISAACAPEGRGGGLVSRAADEQAPAPRTATTTSAVERWRALQRELAAARVSAARAAPNGVAHPATRFLAPLGELARELGADGAAVAVLAERALLGASGARAGVPGAEGACVEALRALATEHLAQRELASACERFGDAANVEFGLDRAVAFLQDVRVKTADAGVREAAGLALARAWYDAIDALPAAKAKELRALLGELAARTPATRRSRAAADLLAAWDGVRVLRTLPDVPAVDVEGRPVLLSALRGKVVLLHVFGSVDEATRVEFTAHEKRLAAHAGRPLAVLGVHAPDAEAEGADALPPELAECAERLGRVPRPERGALTEAERAACERLEAHDRARTRAALGPTPPPWTVAVDGAKDGPWSRRYDVRRRPTTFVIDARGVLRYRDLPATELDLAIAALVAEAEAR